MPDIGKLLWPKTVAVVGASSDTKGLRGRILEVMLSHPYAGKIYPVSRSAAEVQGLKAYPRSPTFRSRPISRSSSFRRNSCRKSWSAAAAPASRPRSSCVPALPRSRAKPARACRRRSRHRARYDMAVSGPNTEGFANIAAALCPTFSPAMDKNAGATAPKRPLGKARCR